MKQRLFLMRRWLRHAYQKLTRGFSDRDLWNLDYTIARFVLPRLKRFKEIDGGYPGCEPIDTPEKWDEALDEMIRSMQYVVDDGNGAADISSENHARCNAGLELFGKWFRALWW